MDARDEWQIYRDLPLLKEDIRLLNVHHREDDRSRIVVNLETADLRESPSFTALSYTWGPPTKSSNIHTGRSIPIICNGVKLLITENLWDFLVCCSQDPLPQSFLWIDAICINQADEAERSRQVRFMSEIYQTAKDVAIWLGKDDGFMLPAFNLLKSLSQLPPDEMKSLHPTMIDSTVSTTPKNILLDLNHWRSLASLLQRTYFTRAWTIQEVAFAQEAKILCGPHSLPWTTLATVSHSLATSNLKNFIMSFNAGSEAHPWHTLPARLMAIRRDHAYRMRGQPPGNTLLYALIRSRTFRCDDGRDKIYTQLSLGNADIFPDYTITVAEAFKDAAKYILEHSDNLLLLSCVEGEEFQSILSLPSWVPDWGVTKLLGLGATGYPQFHAARDIPRNITIYGDELSLTAAKFDDIAEVFDTKPRIRTTLSPSKLSAILSTPNHVYQPTNQSCSEVLWRTLLTDRVGYPIQHPAPSLDGSFHDWVLWRFTEYAKTLDDVQRNAEFSAEALAELSWDEVFASDILPTAAEILRCVHDPAYESSSLTQNASEYDITYSHATFLRLFRTSNGYFGLGTRCSKAGDSVWIVPGSRVPLIFRRVQKQDAHSYRLVGGSYLHGFMLGQALDQENMKLERVPLNKLVFADMHKPVVI